MKQWIAAIVLMLASGASAAAGMDSGSEVYRWKDGSGVMHYSDTPPAGGEFTRVRVTSSLTTTVDDPAPRSAGAKATSAGRVMDTSAVVGVDSASGIAGGGTADSKPAEEPLAEVSAFALRNCTEAQQQLQYVERRATEKPADDPNRVNSRELESAYHLRLTAYNRYQTARDAQLLRVGRYCPE